MDQKARILIIDDDSRNIYALSLVLRTKGQASLSATDVQSGINLLKENPQISIVLLDMMMPEMDGYEAITAIRKIEGKTNLPIVAVTAQAMPGDREKCLAAGANAYVSKPVNVDLLLDVLKQYL
jgi:two-component system cell cycle response regulator DivK